MIGEGGFNWPIDVHRHLSVNGDHFYLSLLKHQWRLCVNLHAFLVTPALEHWFLYDDWHFYVFGRRTEEADHLLSINAFNGLLPQKTKNTLVQSNINSMHFPYPFNLLQQGLDEHSQVETTLRFFFRGILVEIINADGIDLVDDDRLKSFQRASLDQFGKDLGLQDLDDV